MLDLGEIDIGGGSEVSGSGQLLHCKMDGLGSSCSRRAEVLSD